MQASEVLYRYFGYRQFRPGQEALIEGQLGGRDVFGIMPTGGGKSLCYQIPALMLPGITLVISPLISLMKDQVAALKNMGIAAAYLNSSLTPAQIGLVLKNIRLGKYKIIYAAPERLMTDGFLEAVESTHISLLAVDEAHCISQWGQDFRPSYLRIAAFLQALPQRPVVSAFTATATEAVRQDVISILGLREPLEVMTGYDRPNLHFEVLHPAGKLDTLLELVSQRVKKSGIVYCATRKDTEAICQQLQEAGISATRYHGGLSEAERHENQDAFIYDRCRVMVATNAFGMGIDKSNVAYVIHYNMPQSMEAYYQEAGRAGRDGAPAECILLYSAGDVQTAKYLLLHPAPKEGISQELRDRILEQDLKRLDVMIRYCKTKSCLRGYILDYFGEAHGETCGNCGSCERTYVEVDITEYARMILSCVQRIYDRLGYTLGMGAVSQVLHGSRARQILDLGLDSLTTYGLMRQVPLTRIKELMEALESQGLLFVDPSHRGLGLTQASREVLFQGREVSIQEDAKAPEEKKPTRPLSDDDPLLMRLKALRMDLARKEEIPVYIIFSNATLVDMARKMPQTEEEFLTVSGVGQYKADHYGKPFLDLIRAFREEPRFRLPAEKRKSFSFSQEPIGISEIAKRINELNDDPAMGKCAYRDLRDWLVEIGMLEMKEDAEGRSHPFPTPAGNALGIHIEDRVGSKGPYQVVMYEESAQQFILDHLPF